MDDFLLGADDEGSSRRRGRASAGRKRGGRRRRRRRNRGGFLAPLLALIVLVGVIGGGGYYGYMWLQGVTTAEDFSGPGTGEVVIEIRDGATASDVAQTLEEQGVVASARAFTNAIDAAGKSASLQPGDYRLRKGMAAKEAVTLLDPNMRLQTKITIVEGRRLVQIYDELAKKTGKPVKEFEDAAKDLDLPQGARGRLEGYAFPATYEITPKMSAADILNAMLDRYEHAVEEAGMAERAKRLGFSQHEMLTIASIVQAESGTAADMPKIARVIYNRLAMNPPMQLQMDSTVMYALNKYGIAATHAELDSKSPYNTYRRHGLPPGPISNPGEHAIEAALNPAKGPWIYFATTDPAKGITKFTDSYAEFQQFEAEFNRNYKGG
ncbi:ABC transporter substrate-binding protein [Microtetraspora sp. NBRC 13810]|uniref:endolytic transglycosylase MltG n=1 Tax=Microtetraspora sp. NBRC 13810 TaxID=3030990 RepID=UPI0024A0F5B5|nr:endolytic transglycosylase MltG [Microtetraspora sp. NBRC 13810]GLW06354.1 ABC transporter substrate-binding protein [Microtetraspora sp. NBRC 13810]